jgi:hypothetical protein
MKPQRLLVVAVIAVGAAALLVVLVLRPWWQDVTPPALQVPVGLLSLAVGVGVILWLQQKPKQANGRGIRRARLRERVQRQQNDKSE